MGGRGAGTAVIALVLGCAALAAGCNDPERLLVVDLRTDYVPGVEFQQVRTAVRVEGRDFDRVVTHDVDAGADFGSGVRVAELEGLPRGDVRIDLELLGDSSAIVDARRERTRIRKRHLVTVVITRDCEGVTCPGPGDDPSLTECIDARCEDPRCTPEAPEHCSSSGCDTASDCESAGVPACVTPRCEEGSCLMVPEPSACGAGEWCNPDVGCEPLPGSTDAGADAAVDAGSCMEEPCRVVAPQCGCGAAEKCGIDTMTEEAMCVPDGTVATGFPCSTTADCAGSGICTQALDSGPSGPTLCTALCRTDDDCPGADRYCADVFSLDSYGVCTDSCVPLRETGCADGLHCALVLLPRQQDGTIVPAALCTEAGSAAVGEPCESSTECGVGTACDGDCRELCDLDAPSCSSGTCEEDSDYANAVYGGIRHGLCR